MSKNTLLSAKTAKDIDERVERVLRGLGDPEPPLRLEDVRQLLKLDKAFYTAKNPSAAQEKISRIRVATIQIYERPTILLDAIRKLSLKALYLPDRKRILLDGDLPVKKHRWNEAHEIGHSIIPWHDDLMHGDNTYTLRPHCQDQVEAEANFAAGRMLFLRERFDAEARSVEPTLEAVRALHQGYGNTLSTTLYRFVEVAGTERPLIGLITDHPHPVRRSVDWDAAHPCKHFIQSPAFARRFSTVLDAEVFEALQGYCGAQSGGPLGECELILTDDNGDDHRFFFETFFNRYDALTLGMYLKPELQVLPMRAWPEQPTS